MTYKFLKDFYETINIFSRLFKMEYPQYSFDVGRFYDAPNSRYIYNFNIFDSKKISIASSSYTEETFIEELGETSAFSMMKWLITKVDELLNISKKIRSIILITLKCNMYNNMYKRY